MELCGASQQLQLGQLTLFLHQLHELMIFCIIMNEKLRLHHLHQEIQTLISVIRVNNIGLLRV
jgi:hypothetical protein